MTRTGSLVGRRAELEQLLALASGDQSAVVLGDAGVGKTRLVAEVMAHLRRGGRLVATVACLPLAAPLPLLAIVDVLKIMFGRENGLFSTVLESCSSYVRDELARLVPEVGTAASVPAMSGQDWQQQRLFTALSDFCRAVGTHRPWTMVVEDVHWSDSTTLDFLTYLLGNRIPGMSVLLTTRRADPEAGKEEADWLRNLSSALSLTELDLGPLSRHEIDELATTIRGSALTEKQLADLYRRAEGNAFFTEQLLAAQTIETAAGIPEGLAQLLRARAADLQPTSRRVLEALAIAARPLSEPELVQITGDESTNNRRALRDLLTRQLIRTDSGIAFTTKHALLGEAVADTLLPSERAEISGSVATVILRRGDPALAGEASDHFARAGHLGQELPSRVAAAGYAEQMGAFGMAAQDWERATALAESQPDHRVRVAEHALRTMIAWDYSGEAFRGEAWGQRGLTAARAHGQQQIEAALLSRLATIHHAVDPETGRLEYRQALDVFDGLPPSAEQVRTLRLLFRSYAVAGQHREGLPYLQRAIAIGEDPRLRAELVPALISLSWEHLQTGDIARGMATHERARKVAESLDDGVASAWMAIAETDNCLRLNLLEEAARRGESELVRLQTQGLQEASITSSVIANAVEALLELGRVDDAEELVGRVTRDTPTPRDSWPLELNRSRIDLARARLDASASRVANILELGDQRSPAAESMLGKLRAELALWQGQPKAAIDIVNNVLGALHTEDERHAARLLVLGMRASADLARTWDTSELRDEQTPMHSLVRALVQMAVDPFGAHDYFVARAAEGADWRAETERAHGRDGPTIWEAAAVSWDGLGRPHRAAYARWRQAEALLRNGDRKAAATCLHVAWRQADQHLPLKNQLSGLARMARVDLFEPSAPAIARSEEPARNGLTERELDVLRLLVNGLTNSQIGAHLYISPKTASVHVTSILRKLEATNRVHAAAIAQRTGLIEP